MTLAIAPQDNSSIAQYPVSLAINPQQLMLAAIERGSSLEFLERLLAIRAGLQAEEAARQFHEAMASFQAACPVIVKDKIVKDKHGRERYRYADLGSIVRQAGPMIAANGFSYTVGNLQEANFVTATVTVAHCGGHSQKSEFKVPTDKDAYMTEPQKWSSAATFAKRIAFTNAFGILTGDEDDDNDIEHPGHRQPREHEEYQPDPQEVAEKYAALGEEWKQLSRQVFGENKDAMTAWVKAEGHSFSSVAGRQKAVDAVRSLVGSTPAATPATQAPTTSEKPADEHERREAMQGKWYATQRAIGLNEDEAMYACRLFLSDDRDGYFSLVATPLPKLAMAIECLESCDPAAVRAELLAEQGTNPDDF